MNTVTPSGRCNIWPASRQWYADVVRSRRNLRRTRNLAFSDKCRYYRNMALGQVFHVRTPRAIGLRLVELSLTERCQCRCRHCFVAANEARPVGRELSTAEVECLLDTFRQVGVGEVCFTGGEPLLRDDIWELVRHAHDCGLVARVVTNGIGLDDEMVYNLKEAGLSWCSVSLDSPLPENHDAFRSARGCFRKAARGLRLLVEHGVPCSIMVVARREILRNGDLSRIVDLGHSLGVDSVRTHFPVPVGWNADSDSEVLTPEERAQVRRLLCDPLVSMEFPSEKSRCTAASTKLNVTADGRVTPCAFLPVSFGNIRTEPFLEIWKRMSSYVEAFEYRGQCSMCDPAKRANFAALTRGSQEAPGWAGVEGCRPEREGAREKSDPAPLPGTFASGAS